MKSRCTTSHPHQTARERISTRTDLATEGTIFRSLRVDLSKGHATDSPSPSAGGAVLWSAPFFETQHTAKARKQGYWLVTTRQQPSQPNRSQTVSGQMRRGEGGYCPGTSASPTEMKAFE